MCGRFSLTTPESIITDYFGIDHISELSPRYNIAPTQNVLIIRENDDGKRESAFVRWGLVPFWMKEENIGGGLINARVETAYEKPSFRNAFKKRRCLVVSDGFYEWRADKKSKTKQPYYITLPEHNVFAFAGLWERWHGGGDKNNDKIIESCTLLTTDANKQMEKIHNRMPVILEKENYDAWIQYNEDVPEIQDFILHVNNPKMQLTAVSTHVNNPKNDDEGCIVAR